MQNVHHEIGTDLFQVTDSIEFLAEWILLVLFANHVAKLVHDRDDIAVLFPVRGKHDERRNFGGVIRRKRLDFVRHIIRSLHVSEEFREHDDIAFVFGGGPNLFPDEFVVRFKSRVFVGNIEILHFVLVSQLDFKIPF